MKSSWRLTVCFGTLVLALAVGRLWAAAPAVETLELNGLLIDNPCAEEHKNDLPAFVKTHTKECALKPEHQTAGYSLITPDGLVTPFEAKSNAKIIKFLKQPKTKLSVTVKAQLVAEKLELVSIRELVRPKTSPNTAAVKTAK